MRKSDRNGTGGTLSKKKKSVYIFLKVMKLMSNISITSFLLKFAIDRALGMKRQNFTIEIINSNNELNYFRIKEI